jgi:hypothetical protein
VQEVEVGLRWLGLREPMAPSCAPRPRFPLAIRSGRRLADCEKFDEQCWRACVLKVTSQLPLVKGSASAMRRIDEWSRAVFWGTLGWPVETEHRQLTTSTVQQSYKMTQPPPPCPACPGKSLPKLTFLVPQLPLSLAFPYLCVTVSPGVSRCGEGPLLTSDRRISGRPSSSALTVAFV